MGSYIILEIVRRQKAFDLMTRDSNTDYTKGRILW